MPVFRGMKGYHCRGPQVAGQDVGELVESKGGSSTRNGTHLLGAQAMLRRVFPVYHFAAGSFAKGEPEPGIHGWALYIYIGHKIAPIVPERALKVGSVRYSLPGQGY